MNNEPLSNYKYPKIALVTNIPAAYRLDLYERLSQQNDCQFTIFFYGLQASHTSLSLGEISNYNINYTPLKAWRFSYHKQQRFLPYNLLLKVSEFKPDLLLSIGNLLPATLSYLYSKIFNVPLILWWGGLPLTEVNHNVLSQKLRKLVFLSSKGIIAYCQEAKLDLQKLGYSESKIYVLGNLTFDSKKFSQKVNAFKTKIINKNTINLLAVGQLTVRKNYLFLLEVYQKLSTFYKNLSLTIIGEGPEREKLELFCHQNNLKNVTFLGSIPNHQIYQHYAKADIFVHPSLRDQWPQVLNEAMAAQLPVVISEFCGLKDELIFQGLNGYILPLCSDTWSNHIRKLIENNQLRQNFVLQSQKILHQYDLEIIQQQIINFIQSV
jgi:glycosyltransferase involved in cell wall biosynthesis